MKKQIIIVGAIAVCGFVAFLFSCTEGADVGCTCINGNGGSAVIDPASMGAANCAELMNKLQTQPDKYDWTCY
ncbi:hypothetical protein AGMMS50262_06440 [Bacteroidia bacterium]|nr:hypothetical protein AGMMS50262_06440 [Bacteroidia bacterium]